MGSDLNINKDELDARWQETLKGVFNVFIETEVGTDAQSRPSCLGTGSPYLMCPTCPWFNFC